MLSILTIMRTHYYRVPQTRTSPVLASVTTQQVLWKRFSIKSLRTASLYGSWRRRNIMRTSFSEFPLILGDQDQAVGASNSIVLTVDTLKKAKRSTAKTRQYANLVSVKLNPMVWLRFSSPWQTSC